MLWITVMKFIISAGVSTEPFKRSGKNHLSEEQEEKVFQEIKRMVKDENESLTNNIEMLVESVVNCYCFYVKVKTRELYKNYESERLIKTHNNWKKDVKSLFNIV
ncbi:hypothetical protein A0H76_2883 [Hepatospora eriocheir]|uniref:Uncharacterized protein n=1 Tax=Hepatospora eriocheir TaxID=1081669 RepID=A0A1X0Q558_9MICR|nr:hypothetical protein A0H76_2883 [Hepatospora eriocheir]